MTFWTTVNDTGDNAKLFKTEQMANGEFYVIMLPAKNLRRCRIVRNIARRNHNLLAAKLGRKLLLLQRPQELLPSDNRKMVVLSEIDLVK